MRESAKRRDELLDIMDARYEALPDSEKREIAFWGEQEIPQWLKIQRSIKASIRERDDEKRLHLPMPESDEVISFLDTIQWLVEDLINADNSKLGTDIEFDGGQSDSLKRETKKDFIDTLKGFIERRQIHRDFWFEDQYSPLESFTIEELYNFLVEVSKKSEEEIKDFILNEIPSFPWDKLFWTSRKAA